MVAVRPARSTIENKTQSQKSRAEIGRRSVKNRGKELARGKAVGHRSLETRAGSPNKNIRKEGKE